MNSYKRNYAVYFSVYFIAQVIYIYINTYLPIYFFNVLNVDRIELAFVQIFSYSMMFVKPLFSLYFDKERKRKDFFLILGSLGALISFILFALTVELLVIFGIFLGINFAFLALMDVTVDKIIVVNSPTEKTKDNNVLCTQLGVIVGAIMPNVLFFLTISDEYSIPMWNQFLLIGILSVIPFTIIILFLKLPFNEKIGEQVEVISEKPVVLNHIVLMSIYIFLVYSTNLYQYPLEPWAIKKLGPGSAPLFSLFMIIFVLVNTIGIILAGIISNKFDRKRLLIISTITSGIILIIAPFSHIIVFFILIAIMQIMAGFLVINLISIIITLSRKKVLIFQIMASFRILASVIFVPLGTALSAYIETELISAIVGVIMILSIIPIFLMKDICKEQ